MSANPLFRRPHLLAGLAVAGLCAAVYALSLGNGFVTWDDGLLITDNPIIRGLTPATLRLAFTRYDPELYIPLTFLSYQATYAVAGLQPWAYHAGNLLLHTLNALLAGGIALSLTRRRGAAFFVAAVFAVHPLHAEAVAWASARKDVLAAAFFLASWLLYARYREGKPRAYALSVALFALGLLAKVSIITLPAVLLLDDWWRIRKPDRRMVMDKLPYFALGAVFGVVALYGKVGNASVLTDKLLLACKALTLSLFHLVAPFGLSVLYPYTDRITLGTPDLLLSVAVVIAMSALSVWLWLRHGIRAVLFAWGFFVLLMLPTFGNVTKGKNDLLDLYVTSDRYAYLPSLGPLVLAGMLFAALEERWRTYARAGLACLLAVLGLAAARQALVWRDSLTLFTHVQRLYPQSYVAHTNVGTQLMQRGNPDEALAAYRSALAIRNDGITWYNVAQIFRHRGENDKALSAYQNAIAASSMDMPSYLALADLLLELQHPADAVTVLEKALEMAPGNAEAEAMLARVKGAED